MTSTIAEQETVLVSLVLRFGVVRTTRELTFNERSFERQAQKWLRANTDGMRRPIGHPLQ